MAVFELLLSFTPDWLLASAPPMPGVPGGDSGLPVGGNGSGPGGGPGQGGGQSGAGGMGLFLPIIFLFFLFMIFMQITAGRKQKKQHAAMITGLRKHDKVRMLGGIIGTIAEVHDTEVVIKVDESTNTRIRFAKDAVQSVLKPAAGSVSAEPEKVE